MAGDDEMHVATRASERSPRCNFFLLAVSTSSFGRNTDADGAITWLPSARLSAAAHVADDDTRKNGGDTAGLAADADGVFHRVWIDNRTGIPQMWTTTVTIRPKGHSL
jgi:hypothetical protein